LHAFALMPEGARVMITAANKAQLLDQVSRWRVRGINVKVLRCILNFINKEHGVAFAKYHKYASTSGMSERTVQRTIQVACQRGVLAVAYREGAPALWCPRLMDMPSEEAVRRVDLLAGDHLTRVEGALAKLATPPPPYHLDQGPDLGSDIPAHPASLSAPPDAAPSSAPSSAQKPAPDLAPLKPQRIKTNSNGPKSGQGPTPSPSPPTTRPAGRLPQMAMVSGQALDLALQIGRISGLSGQTFNWPEHWRWWAPRIVQGWLDAGWLPEIIVEAVDTTMRSKTDGPPKSIKYFEKPIERLNAGLAAPRSNQQQRTSI
jgi:hypothetical protein